MKPVPDDTITERERPITKRKNTSRWCRGKRGVEHQPELRLDDRLLALRDSNKEPCYLYVVAPSPERGFDGYSRWVCSHIEVCTECSKITRHAVDCPSRPAETLTTWDTPFHRL